MADAQDKFRRDVENIAIEARETTAALVNRLKRMSPEEFLKQPATVFDQLTWKQYREVVSVIAPGVKIAKTKIELPEPEKPTVFYWWREESAFCRSLAWMTVFTVFFAVLGSAAPWTYKAILSQQGIVRSRSAAWPACRRLSAFTDGCVYTPTQDLDWERVAEQLAMPVETLRRANPHMPLPIIVRRAPLFIWRKRGRLEN